MDKQIIRDIFDSYDEITVNQEVSNSSFMFTLFRKQFLIVLPDVNELSENPSVYLYNDTGFDFPHVMLREIKLEENPNLPIGTYRWVCLQESGSIVNSLVSFENKITDTLDRLIELLSMNENEREQEFQKEFLLYWNQNLGNDKRNYDIYLKDDNTFSILHEYYNNGISRLVANNVYLSDLEVRNNNKRIWVKYVDTDVFYIPIVDYRGILPPHKGYYWTAKNIKDIVYSKQIRHVSPETFCMLKATIPKSQNLIIAFGIPDLSGLVFTVRINCTFAKGHCLLEKITDDVTNVEILRTNRKDYLFLNKQIGNDQVLLNKKILLIGAGSLGSYVASELVKSGASRLTIYDGDKLEDANILRWACSFIGKGTEKANILASLLNLIHPEIQVLANAININSEQLIKELPSSDLVIFTIGNSDQQLHFNRTLKMMDCSKPVIYTWLEAGGVYSHILYVNYSNFGCFECLYTNERGELENNRSNRIYEDSDTKLLIRNGCGGTRAAYGSAILLRTTAALLDTLGKILSGKISQSTLIDVSPDSVMVSNIKFPEEACGCCGNRRN